MPVRDQHTDRPANRCTIRHDLYKCENARQYQNDHKYYLKGYLNMDLQYCRKWWEGETEALTPPPTHKYNRSMRVLTLFNSTITDRIIGRIDTQSI